MPQTIKIGGTPIIRKSEKISIYPLELFIDIAKIIEAVVKGCC